MRVFATAAALGLIVAVTAYAANSSDASATQSGSIICTAFHGMHGEGALNGVPRLAGQNADYLSHALNSFKAGTRVSAVMQPIAQNLSEGRSATSPAIFRSRMLQLQARPHPCRASL